MRGEPLTVFRGPTDSKGNPNKQEHGTVSGVISWGAANPSTPIGGRGESASTGAELYVPKGTDLKAKDRVKRASGQMYAVIAGPLWDQPHPLTGRRFDYVVYQLEAA